MISIDHKLLSASNNHVESFQAWLDTLSPHFIPEEVDVIQRACELVTPLYADQVELTGTSLMQHILGTATILVGLRMDYETITAAILLAAPDYLDNWAERIERDFSSEVKVLVAGIFQLEKIRLLSDLHNVKNKDDTAQQVESLRKMLLAMVQDVRVVLIKLAERTQTLRCLSGASAEQQKLIAQQTRSIFAPLANRLGVWQLKWELEDLSVRYLEPKLYKKTAKLLDERRVDREQYIAEVVSRLQQALNHADITAEVTGRPKHIYSIINKMKRKQMDFNELYDVRAVRILVDDAMTDGIRGCYTALGVVHELWPPIESEFDDYIAHPKSNHYRSLHTAVVGPRNLSLEVQIRTLEMHRHSELGVAAHWRYKEGGKSDDHFNEKIAWLRQIIEWKDDLSRKDDLQEQFKNELFRDRIYVLTPQGKVIDLPNGATPVDFSYSLHTDLGHRTRGAKVDGKIVPLNHKLKNGQRVEILTTKLGAPSRDWINPSLGFLQSPRARAKIRAWFSNQNIDEDITQGRAQLDRELNRLGITSINQEKIAQRLHYNKLENFLAALGRNEITSRRIAVAIQEEFPTKIIEIAKPQLFKPATRHIPKAEITVGGVANVMTRIAKCCNPTPDNAIVGYITRDRGITIHRKDCAFLLRLTKIRPERALAAKWNE